MAFGAASLFAFAMPHAAAAPEAVGNWRLFDHNGGSHELYRLKDRKAVLLYGTSTQSKTAKADFATLTELRGTYDEDTLAIMGVASQPNDSRIALTDWSVAKEAKLPILVDAAQFAAQSLELGSDAEAIVLDPRDWSVAYRGPLRDSEDGVSSDLAKVVGQLVDGGSIEAVIKEAPGSPISYVRPEIEPTYVDDVAPLLAANCVKCHSEGNIGPFVMDSYRKVSGWAPMIRETVVTKRMPPWHADPHHNSYSNEARLTDEQARTIVAWVDAGAPRGEGEDILRQAARDAANDDGWELGQPDHVVTMRRAEELPAQGVFDYRYQRVKVDLGGDKWIKGVELMPGNREVLHHALIFVQYPAEYAHLQPEYHGGAGGYFAGYVPGMFPIFYPEDTGKFLPDGSTIIFQMHYTATGKPEEDQSSLGLHFHDGEPPMVFKTRSAANHAISIEPGDRDSEAMAVYRIKEDSVVWGFNPHMHLRGSRFAYSAVLPDGTEKTLLNVPHYDFNWQTEYRLAEPVKLPAGSRIVCEGAFDNSATNPANPDPEEWVTWGDQSWEEMFIGFLSYSPLPNGSAVAAPREKLSGPITEETLLGTEWQFMRFRLLFERGGVIIVNDAMNGTWEFTDDGQVAVNVGDRGVVIDIEGDKMSVQGMPLRQILE